MEEINDSHHHYSCLLIFFMWFALFKCMLIKSLTAVSPCHILAFVCD